MAKDKSAKKEKKEKRKAEAAEVPEAETPAKVPKTVTQLCPIAKPLADEKLAKKVSARVLHAASRAEGKCMAVFEGLHPSPAMQIATMQDRELLQGSGRIVVAAAASPASQPPASPRLPTHLVLLFMQALKLAKKAAKRKQIKRGVKEVIKAIRKKVKG